METIQTRTGSNLTDVKRINRSVVFEAIRLHAPLSRADLARVTGLTPTTITNIMGEFVAAGLVTETPASQTSIGRRPTLIEINTKARYVIGVDLARTKITCGIFDLEPSLLAKESIDAGLSHPSEITMQALVNTIARVLEQPGVERQKVVGIGVSAPGPLDSKKGILEEPPNFPGWSGVPLASTLEDRFGIPVFLKNDADACALAEKWLGTAKAVDNFVYLALGTGVGTGIFVDGKLYEGARGLAGEIGHITIDINGERCDCGNYGCLELYVSVPAILGRARREGVKSPILGKKIKGEGSSLTLRDIRDAAEAGDEFSLRLMDSIGRILGVGVTNIVNAFNPEMVVLGRELATAWGETLLEKVRAVVEERALPAAARSCQIRLSELGDDPAVVGGATIALREFFKDPCGPEEAGPRKPWMRGHGERGESVRA